MQLIIKNLILVIFVLTNIMLLSSCKNKVIIKIDKRDCSNSNFENCRTILTDKNTNSDPKNIDEQQSLNPVNDNDTNHNSIVIITPPEITYISNPTPPIIYYKSSQSYSSANFKVICNKDGYIRVSNFDINSIIIDWTAIQKDQELQIAITGVDLYNANTLDGNVNLKIECKDLNNILNETETTISIAFQSTPPFNFYWIAQNQENWSNAENWSFFPNIPSQAGIPDEKVNVILDENASGDCIMDSSFIKINSLTVTSGYQGFLDAQTNNPNVKIFEDAIFKGKKFYMGNGIWEVGGSFDIETVEIFNAGNSTLKMFGEGALKGNNTASKDFHNLIILGNIHTENNIGVYNGYVEVYGTFTINHYFEKQNGNYLKIIGAAKIEGSGMLYIKDGISEFSPDASLTVANFSVGDDAIMAPGIYGSANVEFWRTSGSRTLYFKNGKYVFLGNVRFNANSNNINTYTINNSQNPSFEFYGNVIIKDPDYLNYNRGSGVIVFKGDKDQQINLGNKIVEDILMQKDLSIAKIEILSNLTCKNLTVSKGEINFNSHIINVEEDMVINKNATINPQALAGTTININGNFYASGSNTNIISFNPNSAWTLNILGYALASYINIDYANLSSSPLIINADTSLIGTNNTNIISKTPQSRYWVATSDGLWSDPNNWSNTSGGAGGFSVPSAWDNVYFDANGSGSCLLDQNIFVHNLSFFGYTGTFDTNNYNLVITGDLNTSGTINMGIYSVWTTYGKASFRYGTLNKQTATVVVRGVDVIFETQLNTLYKVIHDYGAKTTTGWGWNIDIVEIKGHIQGGNCCNAAYETTIKPSGILDHPSKNFITISRLINDGIADTNILIAASGNNCNIGDNGDFNYQIKFGTPWNVDYTCTITSNLKFNSDFIIQRTGWTRTITINNTGNYNLTFRKNVLFDETNISIIWNKGTGNIIFSGNSDQSINFNGKSTENLIIQKTGGILTFNSTINTSNLTAQYGNINFNGQTINVSTNLNITYPTQIIASSLEGSSFNIGGNLNIVGNELHIIDLDSPNTWTLNVNGQAYCFYVKVSNSIATIQPITAKNSINLGYNLGWIFE